MAYHIKITYSNGYRCGCCSRYWEELKWESDLDKALSSIPIELKDNDPHPFNSDSEITNIEVFNGTSGEKIAWASTLWSVGYGRGSGYKYTKWSGFRPDLGSFEVVYSGTGSKIDETWETLILRLEKAHLESEKSKAQRELLAAQERLRILESPK